MKVFALYSGDYEDKRLEGIYTTLEQAERNKGISIILSHGDSVRIVEIEADIDLVKPETIAMSFERKNGKWEYEWHSIGDRWDKEEIMLATGENPYATVIIPYSESMEELKEAGFRRLRELGGHDQTEAERFGIEE